MSSSLEIDLIAEDLLVRARRNELSDNERRKLRALLESSKELELLYRAGLELDRSSALVAGDEARMQRLVQLGRAHVKGRAPASAKAASSGFGERRRVSAMRAAAVAFGIGTLLGAAIAGAVQYAAPHWFSAAALESTNSASAPVAVSHAQRRSSAAIASSSVAVAAVAAATARAVGESAPPRAVSLRPRGSTKDDTLPRGTEASSGDAREDDAAALFARASEARRRGDRETAIRLYERLCERYPESVEAADARVSLGKLKLDEHAAAEALRHFENYPAGTLSAEALWGRAEALKQLSSPEERATLERIVREFPDSPYAAAARKRLEARP